MHAFDVLADPVRRRILEILEQGDHASGEVVEIVGRDFGISQSAVSQHLKVLRDTGLVAVRADAQRRIYRLNASGLKEVDAWLAKVRDFWAVHLDKLEQEMKGPANEGEQR